MNNKNREQTLLIIAVTVILLMVGDKFVLQPLTASWTARSGLSPTRRSISRPR